MSAADDPNAALSICRAAVSSVRAIDLVRDASSQAGSPVPTNPEIEIEHLRELLDAFIDLDRQLTNAGPLPQEWGAQRSMLIVIRDEKAGNQFYGEGEPVGFYDVDLTAADLTDPTVRGPWLEAHRDILTELESLDSTMCVAVLNGTLAAVEAQYQEGS